MKARHICNNLQVVYNSVSFYLSFYTVAMCQKSKLVVAPDLVAEIEAEMKTSMWVQTLKWLAIYNMTLHCIYN